MSPKRRWQRKPNQNGSPDGGIPEELSPKRLRRRLLEFGAVAAAVGLVVLVGPGLGGVRHRLGQASPGWVGVAVALEVLSALSYVVTFRVVFCQRMRWRLGYQIGMAEQGANSVLSVSGIGGLALGAWALRRGGLSTEHIARRSVAFFFLTSFANVAGVIVFAALYAVGVLGGKHNDGLTYGFGAAALAATVLVLLLPVLLARRTPTSAAPDGPSATDQTPRLATAMTFVRDSLGQGIRDAVRLLRDHPIMALGSSVGIMAFDLAVLGVAYRSLHHSIPIGALALGYLIGQLGGNLPVPAGIGGLDAGLIGVLVLYHQPLAVTAGAVLIYRTISIWVPAILGSIAFIQLRRTLLQAPQPAMICSPLADPTKIVGAHAEAG